MALHQADQINGAAMRSSRTTSVGTNPGKAGPKGALGLPGARNKKRGRNEDKNEQRNFVQLTEAERKRSRRDGTN
jgi:hypothetical protein